MLEDYGEIYRVTGKMLPAVLAILTAIYLIPRWFNSTTYKLKHIPTVGGSSGVFSSYFGALRYYFHGHEMAQEGYNKYYGSAFKVSTMSKWLVIVSGPQMVDDVRRATDEYMSLDASDFELLQATYTVGPTVFADPWHINFFRAPLTKYLANHYSDVMDEIICTVGDIFRMKENEPMQFTVHKVATKIISRASSRMFVGLPLCRNSEYLQLSEKFTTDLFLNSSIINMFPSFLIPIVGRSTLSKVTETVKRVELHIRPLVEAHVEQKRQSGDSESKDSGKLISWLVDEAHVSRREVDIEDFTRRILGTNFVSIGGTAAALTDALFNLAAYPEYAAPMREEVEAIVEVEGWTKASIAKMRKVDSFVKETQRMGTGGATGNRKLLKDFTFSNGISLPAGTYISFATHSIHHDAKNYNSPTEFQGFRFADTGDDEGQDPKHQVVSLAPEYLIFGTGRHACPGRFFAAYMIKLAFAHIVLNYDIEYSSNGSQPKHTWFQAICLPDIATELIFKKRCR